MTSRFTLLLPFEMTAFTSHEAGLSRFDPDRSVHQAH
jgi:hypothetical protein